MSYAEEASWAAASNYRQQHSAVFRCLPTLPALPLPPNRLPSSFRPEMDHKPVALVGFREWIFSQDSGGRGG